MTTRLFVAAVGALLAAAGLGAQQNRTSAPDRAQVILTGCVQRADEATAPGGGDTAPDSQSFVLTEAIASTSSPTAAALVVVGTMPGSYRLDASVEKLGIYIGQKVEITGTLAEKPTEPAGAGSRANLPRVLVESVKVIDPTCPK